MPAMPPEHFSTFSKPGRKIRPLRNSSFETSKIVNSYTRYNTRSLEIKHCRTSQQRNSFIRTAVEWNHLDDSTVNLKTIPAFKAKIEENAYHHQLVGWKAHSPTNAIFISSHLDSVAYRNRCRRSVVYACRHTIPQSHCIVQDQVRSDQSYVLRETTHADSVPARERARTHTHTHTHTRWGLVRPCAHPGARVHTETSNLTLSWLCNDFQTGIAICGILSKCVIVDDDIIHVQKCILS